jgi:4-amino-4-deoxy-L-arabinose transferase-like glycosyltransferase
MNQLRTAVQTKWLYFFIAAAAVVNFTGLFVPIIGPDGAIYALIAKTMVVRHDYVDLFFSNQDWLDKPHFPFWVTALSFNLFGFTTWAYKLPGVLFIMMGAVYTYLFAKSLYNKQIALYSVLIMLTAQHIVLSDTDVRAEPYLTGLIIAAVYHFYKAHNNNNLWQLLWGSIFTACAIMTKGMFAIVPIGGAIVSHFIITKQWGKLFSWRWLVAIILVLIFVLPELWCLYQQFDLHPEKVIFGHKGVSGVKFFFWDSQFGRFFNTGPIKGSGDPFFFLHTTLWAFLPWSLLLFAAIFQFVKKGVKNAAVYEWYCISGSLLTFLLFSASKFQLPHYLNIVFPFFAITTAQYLYNLTAVQSIKAIRIVQSVVIVLMLAIVSLLEYFFRPKIFGWGTAVILIVLFLMLIWFFVDTKYPVIQKVLFRTLTVSFIVNLYLNLAFYPSLMKYQASSEAGMWINKNNPQNLPVADITNDYVAPFEYYSDKPVISVNSNGREKLPAGRFLLFAPVDVINGLTKKGWHIKTLHVFERYFVSRLTPSFLNYKTRSRELTQTEIVEIN